MTCSLNAGDECCTGSCVPGNCCLPVANVTSFCGSNATCKSETGGTVGGGVCTTCSAVTGTNPTSSSTAPAAGATGNTIDVTQCSY